jgi:hypothetical protein
MDRVQRKDKVFLEKSEEENAKIGHTWQPNIEVRAVPPRHSAPQQHFFALLSCVVGGN